MNLITRTLLMFLICFIAITLQNTQRISKTSSNKTVVPGRPHPNQLRDKRTFIKKKPVGPVRQVFGLIFEQWNDTRYTWNAINNLLNDQFLPENASLTTTTTPIPDLNVSTKPPPYKITRSEFAKILRRNLRGLVRLYNLELDDALRQSKITEREYRKNVSKEISKFL